MTRCPAPRINHALLSNLNEIHKVTEEGKDIIKGYRNAFSGNVPKHTFTNQTFFQAEIKLIMYFEIIYNYILIFLTYYELSLSRISLKKSNVINLTRF